MTTTITRPPQPDYSAANYQETFLALLPRGRIWDKEIGSPLYQAVATLIPTFHRLSERASYLPVDAFVGATVELLPEWEQTLGLPDPCADDNQSLEQRRAQCVARFVASGIQSIPAFVQFAADLGYTITITEFSPFRVGVSGADTALADESAAFLWQVNTTTTQSWEFGVDRDGGDMALGGFGNFVAECEILRLAPAHTQVFFRFAPDTDLGAARDTDLAELHDFVVRWTDPA